MAEEPVDDGQDGGLLQQMLEDAAVQAKRRPLPKKPASDPLSSLLDSLPEAPTDGNKLTPDRLATEVDAWIAEQANLILSQPEVRRLHVAWRGLRQLVDEIDFRENVLVEFVSCSTQDLANDFEAANSVTGSGLYRRLCDRDLTQQSESYSPTSVVVADYEFGSSQYEIELLSSCAAAAADGHATFVANASPRFFGCEHFSELPSRGDLGILLEGSRYAAWRSFRDTEDAHHVVLCVPRVSRALAIQVAASFAKHRGFDALAGEASCGVDGLRATGDIERDLSHGGFITLVGGEGVKSRFASANARAAASLPNLLSVSRLAHFVEAIAIDLVPDLDAPDLERALQQWLSDSATGAPSLGEAHITVTERGYLRYELAVRRVDGASAATLRVAGRLD